MTDHTTVERQPPIVDAHLDLAYNARLGFDMTLPLSELRESPAGRLAAGRGQTSTVSLPALRDAGVAVAFGTIFVLPHNAPGDLEGPSYATPEEAYALARDQLDYYQQLHADGQIRAIGSRQELDAVLEVPDAGATYPPGVVLLMEGADPIRAPGELDPWWDGGVRIVGPAWGGTRYSGGTAAPGPLTPAGRALMPELDRVGIALDTSHLAEQSFWEALRLFKGPVIASHSNCRRFVPTDRQLSDDMIRAIVDRDGVIGIVLYNQFLDHSWTPGIARTAVGLDTIVRHVEHICELARDVRHVGIGSDLDGGFGREGIPAELESCVDLARIGAALVAAGWRGDEAAGVLGGNWLRWLRASLPPE